MAGSLIFEFQLELPDGEQEPRAPGQPMRMLVMGDFSGRAPDGALASRPVRRVDMDNLDRTMALCAPSVQVTLDGVASSFHFDSLEHFHPDHLYRHAAAFQVLSNQRQRLNCPATFAAAAAQMQPSADLQAVPGDRQLTPSGAPDAPGGATGGVAGGDDFASLLGGPVRQPAAPARGDFEALVKALVGVVPGTDPRQSEFVAAADTVIGERMRALLHAPAFQQLEAAWRGLHLLITSLELDQDLQLYIVDIPRAELAADLQAAGGALQQSALWQLLVEQPRRAPDGAPWSVVVGNYRFGPDEQDVQLLAALGALAQQAGAPLLAGADERVLGCASLAATPDPAAWQASAEEQARWQALRAGPHASWIGLALPRLLLRLPYGKQTDRVEHFNFEEADGQPAHQHYLWGNAAFGLALLLGQAFREQGWEMAPGELRDIGELPAHTFRHDGAAQMQPCAEAWLSERAGDSMLRHGLMPLLSMQNRNAVRLLRSQSLALPPQPLSGPWQH